MTCKSNRIVSVAACGILLASVLLTGCQIPGAIQADVPEPVELHTYQVPVEYRDELRNMLRSALEATDQRIGRVTAGPGGTLLVVAPPRIQAGVREILDKGFDAPPIASPVKLTYWLLVGRPTEPNSGNPAFSLAGGRRVPQLNPVLSEIAATQGPIEFALLERLDVTSVSQQRAQASGKFTRITQRATRTGDQIVSDVEIQLDGNGFQSQVMLGRGQFLVLGQAGFGGRYVHAFPDEPKETLTLYYVMAADLES